MENFTQWHITFLGLEHFGLRVLVLLLSIAAFYFSWLSIKIISPLAKRLLLLLLRASGILLILFLLFQPQVEQKEVLKLKNKLVFLLDNTKSMTLHGGDTDVSRLQLVKDFFKDNAAFVTELHNNFDIDYLSFSDSVKEISHHDIENGLVCDGTNTDVIQTLKLLKKRYENTPVRGYFLFSDGADTRELPSSVNKLEILSNSANDLSAPVFTFSPNNRFETRDVSISHISYNYFTFARNPWKARATIKILGYKNLRLPITLKQGTEIILTRMLETGNEKELEVDLSFSPYTTGSFLYTISLPLQAHEAITENNQVSFLVKVVRDKIRIMHVCGQPSWDERFLRGVLKSDPNIDLISFFILRTPTDSSGARSEELSLIPFPVDELFTQALNSFDLVIFQNFDYRPYDSSFFRFSHYLKNLRDFVTQQGGGFMMIGGDNSFSNGGYNGTALEEILPVRLSPEKDSIDNSRRKAVITDDGNRHPVTTFENNPERNLEIWKELPELDGCNITFPRNDDAVSLATYPSQGNPPLISVRDVGEGRSMAIATDSLWRWNFISIGKGGSNRYYIKFWQNAIKWLTKDPVLNPVNISVNKETALPGEEVQIKVDVLGSNYQPLKDVHVEIDVTNEFSGKSVFATHGTTGNNGQYISHLKHDKEGYFVVKAMAKKETNEIGRDHTVFRIASENREFKDLSIRRDLLGALATASEGRHFDLPTKNIKGTLSLENPPVVKLVGKRQISLWDNGYIFIIIVFIVSTEWWIRKRSGLS